MKKLLGKPRFKIIPRELLPEIAQKIYPELLVLQSQMEKLHPAELTAHYLLLFLKTWKPKTWCEGSIPHADVKNIHENSIIYFIATNRLRLCSPRINRALVEWYRGNYSILLLPNIPTAKKLLAYQINGKRVVNLFFGKEEIASYIHDERDAFSFVCHDLMHADHFFEDRLIQQTQIEFYKCMREAEEKGFLKEPLADPVFKTQWEYLISDMNAHGEHLKQAFQAFLRGYFLRSIGKYESDTLPVSTLDEYNKIIYSLAPPPSPRGSESVCV
ncbi:hypothetical protein K1X76_01430 [bacterium]|nr:hypothetical protein [bacterium]